MDPASSISGVYTALITPFNQNGQIDWIAFDRLLRLQAEAEVDGVVITGTTGESATLAIDEKISLYRRSRAFLPPHIKVMAGTGGNCTSQSIELSKLAQDAGVDSLLIVTPPYNKPSLEGIKSHYLAIGTAVTIPLCLYHVPSRTGQRLSAEELIVLCEIPQIIAVKEASAELPLFAKAAMSSNAAYLSGDDFTYLPSLAVGGSGIISVTSNVFPRAFVKMTKRYFLGDTKGALEIYRLLLPFVEHMFIESNPSPAKAVLAYRGLIQNSLRLPLVGVQPSNYKKLVEIFQTTERALQVAGALA